MGSGEVVPEHTVPADCLGEPFVSSKFQWLPADITVDSHGGVKILSYINNMHPEWHASLYAATALLLQRMIPIFERVLAHPNLSAVAKKQGGVAYFATWCKEQGYDVDDPQNLSLCLERWNRTYREAKFPEQFVAPPAPHPVSLRGRTLQVRRC